jgi:hypothetical protein
MSKRQLSLLTNSEAKTFRRCPREHHLAYDLGLRPKKEAGPLRFGTLLHKGLEAWWLAAKAKKAPETWLPEAHAAMASLPCDDPLDRVRSEELMRGYDIRWGNEPFEVLAVEAEFRCALTNPETGAESKTFELGGKIDAVARFRRTMNVEHKSSGEDISPGSDYWKRLRIDAQISTYAVGARSLGFDVEGTLYDVIGKPKLQPFTATPVDSRKYKKDGSLYANQRTDDETPEEFRSRLREHIAENPDRYYVRGEVPRLEDDERDAAFDLWQTARAIADAQRLGRFPRNDQACMRWGRMCSYFALCAREASIDDSTLFVRSDARHPELGMSAAHSTL